jgi:hypothetical protein
VAEGMDNPQVNSRRAKADDWDNGNYARTDALLDAVSARICLPERIGVDDPCITEIGDSWTSTAWSGAHRVATSGPRTPPDPGHSIRFLGGPG